MFTLVVSTLGNLISSWLGHKQKKAELQQEIELKILSNTADWEATMANASVTSWKDEYLLIIFSLPLIGLFLSPYLDLIVVGYSDSDYVQGGLAEAATMALANLDTAPDWYVAVIFTMVGASFGVKKLTELTTKFRSK